MSASAPETRRVEAPWLKSAALAKVFDALEADGAEARVVGGAVRDALLGLRPGEVDLATTALPEDAMRLAAAAGLAAHPTGLDHGTITIVADSASFEVTTLRRDVETDGRRAVVAFTTDWREDSQRRDFTINGLSCNRDGVVLDHVGGLPDLDAGRVRFIGDAATRIREDYLRILRFFRFSAAYAKSALDSDGLAACIALRDGVRKLSAERIGAEMMKLLSTPRAAEIVAVMRAAGILALVIGEKCDPARLLRLQKIELALGEAADPIARLASLAVNAPADAKPLAGRLRLSNDAADSLADASNEDAAFMTGATERAARASLYRLGPKSYLRAARVAWARSGASEFSEEWRQRATVPDRWAAPTTPFSGKDILALGMAPGPRVGAVLERFEAWWVEEDFPDDRERLSAKLAALAQSINE